MYGRELYFFILLVLLIPVMTVSGDAALNKVTFDKVLEFSDNTGDFHFKYPDNPYKRGIQVDDKGNIYILDADRILKFDKKGSFVLDITSTGQGPGEVNNIDNFVVNEKGVIIYNIYPAKIIFKNKNGELLKEFRLEKELDQFITAYNKQYYFFDYMLPTEGFGSAPKIFDLENILFSSNGEGRTFSYKEVRFPQKIFMAMGSSGSGLITLAQLQWVNMKDSRVYISNTQEYGIKLLDLKNKKIVTSLTREYERQRVPEKVATKLNRQGFAIEDKIYRRPPQKYLNDIRQLLKYKNQLWVVTSTVDENRGVLVDIFQEDKYSGGFFLKLSERNGYLSYFYFHAYIMGEYLYIIERDIEDNPFLVKYKIHTQ